VTKVVQLNESLNRLIIQCDDGCTYLNSSFSLTNITVMYKGGSIGIGVKNRLEDGCDIIIISKKELSSNKFLIACSRYCEENRVFDTYFSEIVDFEAIQTLELSERYVAVIKAIIERRFKNNCHEKELQEM
jgi:hypothetical protein